MAAGRPKKFSSGQELVDLWQDFCDEIVNDEYIIVPTQTEFCKWLKTKFEKTDRKTIYNSLEKYFPTIKKQFETIRGDVISQGAMVGHYQPTMSIFALKNWCHWSDKTENISTVYIEDDDLTKSLEEIGKNL